MKLSDQLSRDISHAFGMKVFMELVKTSPLKAPEDYLDFILKTYQEKFSSFKRLYPVDTENIEKKILETREVLKGAKGCENEVLPLPSVLKLQERRAEIVTCIWTGELTDEEPNEFGFEQIDGNWKPKLQCDDDPFYSNPKTMLGGCGCKTKCSDKSNRCSCQKKSCKRQQMLSIYM